MLKRVFAGKTQDPVLQFIRYLFVGGTAALADTGTLYFLTTRLSFHHLTSGAIGFTVGLVVNYLFSIAWVFESRGRFKQEFLLFSAIGVGGLLLTEFILWLTIDVARSPILAGKATALVLVLAWNFGMRKKFVFPE